MLQNMRRNRFWLVTGIETFFLGTFFLYAPDFIHDASPFHSVVNVLDDTWVSIVLLIIATFTIVSSCFQLQPDWHRINVFVLQFAWTLYATGFLVRDINDPHPPLVALSTILFWGIVVRIYLESRWGDPGDADLKIVRGEGQRLTKQNKS